VSGGLIVGLLAQAARALSDAVPPETLFSGQAAIPDVLTESTGALLVILVAKAIAYAVCLGCGFRGGPVFPAVFLGVLVATFAVVWFDVSETWAVAVGAAAGMAAGTGLLFSALLFSLLLVGLGGQDALPAAVLGATAAWLTRAALSGMWPGAAAATTSESGEESAAMDGVTIVFGAVVGARFLVPLLIPLYPLPAVIACLVLDAADQSIFQAFGYDPPGYQSYDKAMDVFYLAIAYLATMRNWQALPAYSVGRFLYFYRLVGVVAFELSHVRALLLVFPNTFEYFFIAYEGIRTRWAPALYQLRWWVTTAALIWIFVKLPQEWWIHVAQLDFTDFLAEHSWATPLLVVLFVVAALVFWFVIRPRLRPADHPWQVVADPLPEGMDTAELWSGWQARYGAVRSMATAEKVVLLGLISVIYAQTLPGVDASNLDLFIGIGIVVVVNAAVALFWARRKVSVQSTLALFAVRLGFNVAFVLVADWLLGTGNGDIDANGTFFFLVMISLITSMHDRYYPVLEFRRGKRLDAPTPV
jgi:hypothetical protein